MSDNDLKKCPFCGGNAKMISTGFGMSSFYVMCVNEACNVSPATRYYHEEKEAAEAWNTREKTPGDISENVSRIDTLIKSQKEHISEIDKIIDRMYKKLDALRMTEKDE